MRTNLVRKMMTYYLLSYDSKEMYHCVNYIIQTFHLFKSMDGLLDHNALTSIVSFNLPFFPPQEFWIIGFLIVSLSLIDKVLVLSQTEIEERGLQSFLAKGTGH